MFQTVQPDHTAPGLSAGYPTNFKGLGANQPIPASAASFSSSARLFTLSVSINWAR